jgi:D-glycero-alpha-D-manno-heptose-7-phosphate kinase
MIICRTPYRISFFGGGTDYPNWYREHGGTVLATTINKYCYLTCRFLPPFFEHRLRIVWSKIETCASVDEIAHPAVREVLQYLKIERGVEIHHDGDLPARSGMGSSSAFTIGLLHVLHALKGEMVSKHQLALEGIHIEQDCLKELIGSQDQVMAAYGGFNQIMFVPNGEIVVKPLTISSERLGQLNSHLMLFYTGIKRTAAEVAGSYINGMESRRRQLRILKDLVDEGVMVLSGHGNIDSFGELLHEAWAVKRSLSTHVSNDAVDEIYEDARLAGALGGKLLGAGGGGFLLLFVPPERQVHVKERLNQLIHVPFRFEFTGSQIIFLDREEDYAQQEQDRARRPIRAFQELCLG